MPLIQVAGIIDRAEAEMVAQAGANLLGFPFGLPVNREDLSHQRANSIMVRLPNRVAGVLITYLNKPRDILALMSRLGVRVVQLHGEVSPGEIAELHRLRGDIKVIKSLIVRQNNVDTLLAQMASYAPVVAGFITDTFDPATGATGATGKIHDWDISRAVVRRSPRPVILAGGLTPDNVREAICQVCPAGVDAHTGLEGADGRKDPGLVKRFVAAARIAFSQLDDPGPEFI